MSAIFPFMVYHGVLCVIFVSAKLCDPANYICSGKCPDVPQNLKLPHGVAVCLKDSVTKACVCWLNGDYRYEHSWFHCEAVINGSVQDISCKAPMHCFPPDSEPTCLVMPYCDCRVIRDTIPFQYGAWMHVKALVELYNSSNSGKYSNDVQDFSVKHLLFLLGFVIAPLACWCFLNFINENKCKRKSGSTSTENAPVSAANQAIQSAISSTSGTSTSYSNNITCADLSVSQPHSLSTELDFPTGIKDGCPPTYDEATYSDFELDNESPPAYADVVSELEEQELLQTMLIIHPEQEVVRHEEQ